MENNKSDIAEVIRKYFEVYMEKDWDTFGELLSDDFVFSSPKDDYINKEEHLKSCMFHSSKFKSIGVEKIFDEGSEAFVRYKAEMNGGNSFRNTEFFVMDNGKIKSIDVYFGR
ncbi:MAG: nuclear transport factor 2 family protein [Bacteroidetes bacterium]|nr:nuclear transport factor 2 family protein [Bacteroidota bacterium]